MGYIGTKMSERAVEAHNNGEKPFSQWSKAELLACLPSAVFDNAKKLTIGELRGELLHYSSWHHTGSCYNQTNFYSISEDAVDRLTNDGFDFILKNRQKKEKKAKERTREQEREKVLSAKISTFCEKMLSAENEREL